MPNLMADKLLENDLIFEKMDYQRHNSSLRNTNVLPSLTAEL